MHILVLVAALALPLHGRTVVIDPGHNGANWSHPAEINRLVDAGGFRKACDTTGTSTNDGYAEAAYNLDVALRLARILRAAGARVVLTRTTNEVGGRASTSGLRSATEPTPMPRSRFTPTAARRAGLAST
jgi:N-acetylmuramoyl-L-alanine amidase